ncbi:MAG TPA: hypothetical protein VH558_08770 [Pseudolabrys sp.]|jgi:hypothetical protein
MKAYGKFAKSAAVAVTFVAIGLGVQQLNARATSAAVGTPSKEISSIAPLEMMQSVGQLPITIIDDYI